MADERLVDVDSDRALWVALDHDGLPWIGWSGAVERGFEDAARTEYYTDDIPTEFRIEPILSTQAILQLRDEASARNDHEAVRLCNSAIAENLVEDLGGEMPPARRKVWDMIQQARALEDDGA